MNAHGYLLRLGYCSWCPSKYYNSLGFLLCQNNVKFAGGSFKVSVNEFL